MARTRTRLAAAAAILVTAACGVAQAASWPPLDPVYRAGGEPWLGRIGWTPGAVDPEGVYPAIAVVDSGVSTKDPELAGYVGPDSFDCSHGAMRNALDSRAVEDAVGHGTIVAKLAAAPPQGYDIIGVSPFSPLIVGKFTDDGGDLRHLDCALAGVETLARSQPVVVNLSLAGRLDARGRALVGRLVADGALVVAATGNASDRMAIGQPAILPHTLAVGTIEPQWRLGGPQLDLLAPGSFGAPAFPHTYGGSSFAAPLAAGAAAVLWGKIWARGPAAVGDNPQVVAYLLRRTASLNRYWTPQLGFGTVSVSRALAAPVPRISEYEPNDDPTGSWRSRTARLACSRGCLVRGIVGRTDDAADWWPVRAASCHRVRLAVRALDGGRVKLLGCRAVGRGKLAVGVAATSPLALYQLRIRIAGH